MLRNTLSSAARAVARRLPERAEDRLLGRFTRSRFQLNVAGLAVRPHVLEWVGANRRAVSIVIPSYNDVPLLTECLKSIEDTCAEFDYEVIVVDDYCQPDNQAKLSALESGRVRMIFKERREGFAVSVNVGMAEALHDIVLLNSDIVAQPGWLDALQYAAYATDPRVGLVSPKLVYPDGSIQYGGSYYARVLAPQWFGHLYVGSAATRPMANVAGYNRSISGACLYITSDAYAQLGGLDETYWLGFEDVDYGLQAWRSGIRCWYEPQSLLIHHESASRGYSQGKRELASMRHFWSRWAPLFLHRTLDEPLEISYVISSHADPLWRVYVAQQAAALKDNGVSVRVHEIAGPEPDERIVSELAARGGVVVCSDWGAEETVWLATLEHGKPVYLLPTVESGAYPDDPELQMRIVAHYRPEFDYIAANKWGADQLRAETAWEARHRLIPALAPSATVNVSADPIPLVVTVGMAQRDRTRLEREVLRRHGRVDHVDRLDAAGLERLAAAGPSVIVSLEEYPNSLAPLAMMSLGAAYVGRPNPRTNWEVLDGYNALLVDPSSHAAVDRALDDLLGDQSVRAELGANARDTAQRFARVNADEMLSALRSIARTAV